MMMENKVNIRIKVSDMVSLNLLSSTFGCKIFDCHNNRASIAIRDENSQCPLLGEDMVNAPCVLEWPGRSSVMAVVESVRMAGTHATLGIKFIKPMEVL